MRNRPATIAIFTLALLYCGRISAQVPGLYLKSWKKANLSFSVSVGQSVDIRLNSDKEEPVRGFISYEGVISGFSDKSIFLRVRKKDRNGFASNDYIRQEYTNDSLMPVTEIPFERIGLITLEKKRKGKIARRIIFVTSVSSIALAPVASVNHFEGRFNPPVFWIMLLGGYLLPVTELLISTETTCYVHSEKPEDPGRKDCYFVLHR